MMLQSFDISGPEPRIFNQERYENEKQRKRLIEKAKNDAKNSPGSVLWIADITKNGIEGFPLEGA